MFDTKDITMRRNIVLQSIAASIGATRRGGSFASRVGETFLSECVGFPLARKTINFQEED